MMFPLYLYIGTGQGHVHVYDIAMHVYYPSHFLLMTHDHDVYVT